MKLVYEGYGFRLCTPDQMPVIGRVPKLSNLYIAGGQCRLDVTLEPITGTVIRNLIDGKKPKAVGLS